MQRVGKRRRLTTAELGRPDHRHGRRNERTGDAATKRRRHTDDIDLLGKRGQPQPYGEYPNRSRGQIDGGVAGLEARNGDGDGVETGRNCQSVASGLVNDRDLNEQGRRRPDGHGRSDERGILLVGHTTLER